MQVQSLGWEDALKKRGSPLHNIPAWKIPWNRGDWPATVHGVAKSRTQLKQLAHSTHNIPSGL